MSGDVAAGRWPRVTAIKGREIEGMTLGIVGFGSIGRLTAQLGHRMGMRVLAYAPSLTADAPSLREIDAELLPLDDLLARSDVVSLHMPLNDITRGLIDARRLACMQAGSVLINTARAGVIDQSALVDALCAGRLHGAAIDVYETEPLPAGSAWADVPGLLLTPHIAGVTVDAERRVGDLIADRVLELLR
jgi:(S)-sulfolactate dehydrogenase